MPSGPVDTHSRTALPSTVSSPARGTCRMTRPAATAGFASSYTSTVKPWSRSRVTASASGRFVTLRTLARAGPSLTVSSTTVATATRVPGPGCVRMTVPTGRVSLASRARAPGTRPASRSRASASAWVSPATLGTVVSGGDFATVRSTVSPVGSAAPPAGRCVTTVPGADASVSTSPTRPLRRPTSSSATIACSSVSPATPGTATSGGGGGSAVSTVTAPTTTATSTTANPR